MHSGNHAASAPEDVWIPVVDSALAQWRDVPGALLPILHAIHDALGHIPPACKGRVAEGLNLSLAEVHGVVTFYHDFRSSPPGRHVMKLCRAEACQAMGSDALAARIKARTGTDVGGTTLDGALTVQAVYCLGNCACSPALMLDGRLVGRVTPERLDHILDATGAGASVAV
jgi:formate dehydrogenase subunit gamma